MTRTNHRTMLLGDLIVAEFDKAARFVSDPQQISHRAVWSIREVMRQTRDLLAKQRAGAGFAASIPPGYQR